MNYSLLKEDILLKNYGFVKEVFLRIKKAVHNHEEKKIVELEYPPFFTIDIRTAAHSNKMEILQMILPSNATIAYIQKNKIYLFFTKWERKNVPFDIVTFFYFIHYHKFLESMDNDFEKIINVAFSEIVYFLLFQFYFYQRIFKFSTDAKKLIPFFKNITSIIDKFLRQEIDIYGFVNDLISLRKFAEGNFIKNKFLKILFLSMYKKITPVLKEALHHYHYEENKEGIQKIAERIAISIRKVNKRAKIDVDKYFAYAMRIAKEIA